ncbi:hypothetical protein B0H67DRAFT_488228 [Lasiosphaeris hirsuta]|uniref:C2H2-type domain-containing protein n=1 Tax=Lasiosphaeris hirsuta TaxID=260670 RepID=A0AA40AI48_9PEZI|nr:hypothetical protein B0H67DRAFT_488228 [Lasiosphaeris hirsuta]
MSANFNCKPCKRDFKAEEGLQRHLQDSARHRGQRCEACNRSFATVKSLQQHIRDSPAHDNPTAPANKESTTNTTTITTTATDTPLDKFFLSFPSFAYNPSLSPTTSYGLLRKHMGWPKDSAKGGRARERYNDALVDEINVWFGSEHDLRSWHTLCRAIGIQEVPHTIDECAKVVRKTHVNIVDLIQWGRGGGSEDASVRVFESFKALRRYTLRTRKFFPRNKVANKQGETNVVLRHLLRRFFFGAGWKRGGR